MSQSVRRNWLNQTPTSFEFVRAWVVVALSIFACVSMSNAAVAQSRAVMVRELTELVTRQFSKEVASEGSELLAKRIEASLVRYGDDAADAIRKVGPRAMSLMDEAGDGGVQAARLLSKYGDEAIWVVGNASRRSIAAKLGDEAAEAMIRQGEIAEPLIAAGGKSVANALCNVSTQNGRRIAMLSQDAAMSKLSKSSELMDVVGKYGDRAMDFIWKNKGALVVGAALTSFLADPEPFLDGSKHLADIAATNAIAPIADQIATNTNWTGTILGIVVISACYLTIRPWLKPRRR